MDTGKAEYIQGSTSTVSVSIKKVSPCLCKVRVPHIKGAQICFTSLKGLGTKKSFAGHSKPWAVDCGMTLLNCSLAKPAQKNSETPLIGSSILSTSVGAIFYPYVYSLYLWTKRTEASWPGLKGVSGTYLIGPLNTRTAIMPCGQNLDE